MTIPGDLRSIAVLAVIAVTVAGCSVPVNEPQFGLGEPETTTLTTEAESEIVGDPPRVSWGRIERTDTPVDIERLRFDARAREPRLVPDVLWFDLSGVDTVDFGQLNQQRIEQLLGSETVRSTGLQHLALVEDPELGTVLRQRYAPTGRGSDVVQFPTVPLGDHEEMWLSYRVFVEEGFEPVKGGKLPGLAGGNFPSGGDGADGTDGFSARFMWRPDNTLYVYAYHPDRPGQFGEAFDTTAQLPIGRWAIITQHVRMNTGPGEFDGEVSVWVDGRLALEQTGVRWRTTGDFGADVFAYSSFYGGNASDWAPPDTNYIRFSDVRVATTPDGVLFSKTTPLRDG